MAKLSSFHKVLIRDKGLFSEPNVYVSADNHNWTHFQVVSITKEGSIVGEAELGHITVLALAIQSCYVQIIPSEVSRSPRSKRRQSRLKAGSDYNGLVEDPPLVCIGTTNNERLYIRVSSKHIFGKLLSCLIAWQNLRLPGLAKKWYADNRVHPSTLSDPHELLVCRFKIYGPLPPKSRNVNLASGVPAPLFNTLADTRSPLTSHGDSVQEGWFYVMGALKSNGMLNFITELDGTLLYSIDVKNLLSSEIREVHTSIFSTPNILFLGHIHELRQINLTKTTSAATLESISNEAFLLKDGRPVANNLRIFIEFPLHIDLEDWFVGLKYFCKREYIGMYNKNSKELDVILNRIVDLEGTLHADSSFDFDKSKGSFTPSSNEKSSPRQNDEKSINKGELSKFSRDHLRVSKQVTLDIIEASFDSAPKLNTKIYAEVVMWGLPWSRTALVDFTSNTFWKEEFSTELPILTQMIRIVIKRAFGKVANLATDVVIGSVYLTPDILGAQVPKFSTMLLESSSGDEIMVPGLVAIKDDTNRIAAGLSNIIRLSIYESGHIPIGKLLLTVDLKEHHVPSPTTFSTLETMLINCPMKDLIFFCNSTVEATELQNVSFMLLDIFQSLGVEEKWFKALMEVELATVDEATRKNYVSKGSSVPQSMNVFNTLFRGSSIFSKSLEKYLFRVGQEYLEKVFGDFFEKLVREDKNCELDARYIKLSIRKRRGSGSSGSGTDDDEDEDDDSSDSEETPEQAKQKKAQVEEIVEENYQALLGYVRDVWQRIFTTSNDLPQQIKNQLKNFRTKVDFACDPSDKATALNCLSAFMFLRFFCPAILNPKLFHLTKDHQVGNAQRTLTLVAKVLLNLANRQKFTEHKEPHLIKMNDFLDSHEREVLDYFDKLTGRKNDFNEKVLDLSHEMKRFDMGLGGSSGELPTTPYLIDKYLRLTEFVELLKFNTAKTSHTSLSTQNQPRSQFSLPRIGSPLTAPPTLEGSQREGDLQLLANRESPLEKSSVYQIGTLEFEKAEFLDLAGDNETEGFIKTLCRSNENIFSFIKSAITISDLQKESTEVSNRIVTLSLQLVEAEVAPNLQHNSKLWEAWVDDVIDRGCLDARDNSIVFQDPHFKSVLGLKKLADGGLSSLRLRFPLHTEEELSDTFSTTSISGMLKVSIKNPFKKWLKRE